MRAKRPDFRTLEEMVLAAAEMVRPPERLTVSQAAEKYRYLENPGSYVGYWNNLKAPYLIDPMNVLTSLEYTGMVFVGPARTGKALALTTPIPTPRGWSKMGDLSVGDEIYAADGRVCRVVATSEVMYGHECYRVSFADGDSIVADAGHVWQVTDIVDSTSRVRKLTTAEIAKRVKFRGNRSRWAIEMSNPLEGHNTALPVDPYVLGVWLGDGSSYRAHVSSGAQDCDEMLRLLNGHGVECRVQPDSGSNFNIILSSRRHNPGRRGGSAGISAALQSMGLCGRGLLKHIPSQYLRAPLSDRRELLRGLMDTDGHVDKRGLCEFVTTSHLLAQGFEELLTSLGYKWGLTKRPAASKTAHRYCFSPAIGDNIFLLSRKQARLESSSVRRNYKRLRRRYIADVQSVRSVPVKCIQVDHPDHLFLAGRSMTPTHNSDMFLNWLGYTAKCDPADMMRVDMTKDVARDWSIGDLAKMLRHSKEIGSRLSPGRQNDNVHDKRFKSGMRLLIKWPSITEVSGKTVPRCWIADYDRIADADDIGKEGPLFDLVRKRTESVKRHGMTVAESSPGREIEDPNFIPVTPHQAPPTKGILGLYNRGDRRRMNWRCLKCREPFEPDFSLFEYPTSDDLMESAEAVVLVCPSCSFKHTPSMKAELQEHERNARWIRDNMRWMRDGSIQGVPIRTDIASFWLKGPAAIFQSWEKLVFNYLQAKQAYDESGDEGPLKKTVTADQGLPYISKSRESSRLPDDLKNRALNWGGTAPT